MFGGEIAWNDFVAAVMGGENEIGTGAVEIRREQKLRVGDIDGIGMRWIDVDYGRRRPITTLSRKRSNHCSPLPFERDKESPSCQLSAATLAPSPAAAEPAQNAP